MMNSMNVPSKRSTLERKLDKLILALFGTLFMMCLIGAIGSGIFINQKYYYLGLDKGVAAEFNPSNRFVVAALTFFTLITLYSTVIPISLYVSIEVAQRNGIKIQELRKSATAIQEKGFNFDDHRLMRGAWRNEPNSDTCKVALYSAGLRCNFCCFMRTHTMIHVRESCVEKMGKIQDVAYEILNVLEFNSTRKRQSVVCRYPNGRLVLYCKGADTVIYERLASGNDDLKKVNRAHLEQFGSAGLRTLCLAYRELSPETYESWNEKFIQAKSSLRGRETKLDEVAELIEKDLILIGSTAIEDKLQEGVPACIETLSRAGIKVWVLTGDQMGTAINIAYACNLINNEMKQFIISSETDAIREVENRGDQVEIACFIKEEVKKQLKKCLEEAQHYLHSAPGPKLTLVIDGKCLMYALDPTVRVMLLNLSLNCTSVVCCRVSPLQKAQVTSMVKKGARKITLSIGDGANDQEFVKQPKVDVSASLSKRYPELYKEGIRDAFFKWRVVVTWACFSVYQSLVFYHFAITSSASGGIISALEGAFWHGSCSFLVYSVLRENVFFVIYVLMSTFYFYLTVLLVPIVALFGDFIYLGIQRWFFPYDYQIVQEIHRHELDDNTSAGSLEVGRQRTAQEEGNPLPREISRHTGFAFDSPGFESFFAAQLGIYAPQKAWDVARRASMKSKPKMPQRN
ncbi:hypothetical protein OIU76_014341 [Salix suchowensis]|nr:hypothetical protein OIU76_014341 [Salix suchowensis]